MGNPSFIGNTHVKAEHCACALEIHGLDAPVFVLVPCHRHLIEALKACGFADPDAFNAQVREP